MEEHKKLELEYDRNLLNKIFDDLDNRYITLFLYIIRKDLFKNIIDEKLIDAYNHILSLDEVYKGNILSFFDENFINIATDLGIFKNIRNINDFDQKEHDFIIKLGENPIIIRDNTILVPEEILFMIISRKFKKITKRNYNLALLRLKGVRCEVSSIIHPFIYEIGEKNYTLSDDLYNLLDPLGNIYRAIKVELTIEKFYEKFTQIQNRIINVIQIFDIFINRREIIKKINNILKDSDLELEYVNKKEETKNTKFKEQKLLFHEIEIQIKITENKGFKLKLSNSNYQKLINYRTQMKNIEEQILEMRKNYSLKNKKYNYLEFIKNISEKEHNIQNGLISLREEIKVVKSLVNLMENDIKVIED